MKGKERDLTPGEIERENRFQAVNKLMESLTKEFLDLPKGPEGEEGLLRLLELIQHGMILRTLLRFVPTGNKGARIQTVNSFVITADAREINAARSLGVTSVDKIEQAKRDGVAAALKGIDPNTEKIPFPTYLMAKRIGERQKKQFATRKIGMDTVDEMVFSTSLHPTIEVAYGYDYTHVPVFNQLIVPGDEARPSRISLVISPILDEPRPKPPRERRRRRGR